MSFDDHPPPPPLDLLDEYWFFSNTLDKTKSKDKKKKPPLPPPNCKSPCSAKPSLLRTPSLPPPHVNDEEEDDEEELPAVDDDDLNWSSIYEGVLRTRNASSQRNSCSRALHRAPSMPVPPSDHSYSTLERHCRYNYKHQAEAEAEAEQIKQTARSSTSTSNSKQQQHPPPPAMMVRSKSAMFRQAADKKMWKSSSDLESIEVQGFKDLGFVFDKEELRENLADVLPGLKNGASSDHGAVRRPYLSEAWQHGRRAPALIRVQSEVRSAAEMKDQLRMWAQAVACNVRKECV